MPAPVPFCTVQIDIGRHLDLGSTISTLGNRPTDPLRCLLPQYAYPVINELLE